VLVLDSAQEEVEGGASEDVGQLVLALGGATAALGEGERPVRRSRGDSGTAGMKRGVLVVFLFHRVPPTEETQARGARWDRDSRGGIDIIRATL